MTRLGLDRSAGSEQLASSTAGHSRPRSSPLLLLALALLGAQVQVEAGDGSILEGTFDEGTWLSVDVAPDGTELVFDFLGGIYRLPVDGGEAVAVVEGPEFASQPRWSPDGAMIAFVSDASGADNLWLVTPDGDERIQVSAGRRQQLISPAWSADGRSLIVSRIRPWPNFGRQTELVRYPLDAELPGGGTPLVAAPAGRPSLLVSSAPAGPLDVAVSPDGERMAYALSEPRQHRTPGGPWAKLYVHATDLESAEALPEPLALDFELAHKPVWSPDGQTLVYAVRTEAGTRLRAREMASGAERWVEGLDAGELSRDDLEAAASRGSLPNWDFLPDGRHLVAALGGKLWKVALDGSGRTPIPFRVALRKELLSGPTEPVRLPRGPVQARLAQGVELFGDCATYSMLAEIWLACHRQPPERLTSLASDWGGAFQPVVTVDHSALLFVTWSAVRGGHVWRLGLDGRELEQLTEQPASYRDLVALPYGAWAAVRAPLDAARRNDPRALPGTERLVIADAGGVRDIGPAGGVQLAGSVQRKEESLLVLFARGHLRLVDLAGATVSQRLVTASAEFGPLPVDQVSLDRDGRRGAARSATRTWEFEIDADWWGRAGQEVPPFDLASLEGTSSCLGGCDAVGWHGSIESAAYVRTGKQLAHSTNPPDGGFEGEHPLATVLENDLVTDPPSRFLGTGEVVLRGATVLTGRSAQYGGSDLKRIEDADVWIRGDRVAGVGPRGSLDVPADVAVEQVDGYLIPGLIDLHAHWMRRRDVLQLDDAAAQANLAFGVTTVRDPQSMTPDVFAYADLIEAGKMVGSRVLSTGGGIFSMHQLSSYEETLAVLRRYRDHYETHWIKSYLVGDREHRLWVARAARELGLRVTTEGGADLKMDLTHAIDGLSGNEHNLPTTPIYRDVVELYARSGIAYTPTMLVTFGGRFALEEFLTPAVLDDPRLSRFLGRGELEMRTAPRPDIPRKVDHIYPSVAADALAIRRAGGLVGAGGHGEMQGLQMHWEMQTLVEGGFTPAQALLTATTDAAHALGLQLDIGSIEQGRIADLVLLEADPSEEISNSTRTVWVMKDGIRYDPFTLEQTWPERRPGPPRIWERE